MTPHPPRTAERILASLGASAKLRDDVLGDLAEEFASRTARDGERSARRWYWRESLRATPHLLRDWTRTLTIGDLAHLGGAMFGAYVCVIFLGLMVLGVESGVLRAFGMLPARYYVQYGATPALLAIIFVTDALLAIAGGYIAASFGRRAPLFCSSMLGVTWTVLAAGADMFVIVPNAQLLWLPLIALAVIIVGTTTGGVLWVRKSELSQLESSLVESAR